MFREWVVKKRIASGLTLAAAAEKAGLSKSFWWEVEQGKYSAGIESAEKMAGVFGVKLSTALRQCGK